MCLGFNWGEKKIIYCYPHTIFANEWWWTNWCNRITFVCGAIWQKENSQEKLGKDVRKIKNIKFTASWRDVICELNDKKREREMKKYLNKRWKQCFFLLFFQSSLPAHVDDDFWGRLRSFQHTARGRSVSCASTWKLESRLYCSIFTWRSHFNDIECVFPSIHKHNTKGIRAWIDYKKHEPSPSRRVVKAPKSSLQPTFSYRKRCVVERAEDNSWRTKSYNSPQRWASPVGRVNVLSTCNEKL